MAGMNSFFSCKEKQKLLFAKIFLVFMIVDTISTE